MTNHTRATAFAKKYTETNQSTELAELCRAYLEANAKIEKLESAIGEALEYLSECCGYEDEDIEQAESALRRALTD